MNQTFETRTFEKIRFAAQQAIARECLTDAQFEVSEVAEFAADKLVMQIRAAVWAYQDREEVELGEAVPETWWDAAKQAFSDWLTRRGMPTIAEFLIRNVRMRIVRVQVRHWHVFPNADLRSPNNAVKVTASTEEKRGRRPKGIYNRSDWPRNTLMECVRMAIQDYNIQWAEHPSTVRLCSDDFYGDIKEMRELSFPLSDGTPLGGPEVKLWGVVVVPDGRMRTGEIWLE